MENCKPIIILCAYWDIYVPDIQRTLIKGVKEAIKLKYDLLIEMDSNALHSIWLANTRGETLVSFLSNNNLHIINHGNIPTFTRINCATHIDVMIVNTRLISKIRKWKILKDDTLSDHSFLHSIFGKATMYTKSKLYLLTGPLLKIY